MCGLSHGDSDQSYTDIDYAIYLTAGNGTVQVYEGGVSRGDFGAYATGDVFRVALEGGVIKYRKNGTVFYTSLVAPTLPLLVDTSLNTSGCHAEPASWSTARSQTWRSRRWSSSVPTGNYATPQNVAITRRPRGHDSLHDQRRGSDRERSGAGGGEYGAWWIMA
jgi:hypothetical protein